MSNITIKTTDAQTVTVDRALLEKFSVLVKVALSSDNDVRELALNISHTHMKLVVEYIEHHSKKETNSPVPPLTVSWTLANSFEDKWDGEFLARVLEIERDTLLIAFCRSVEYLDMETLLKKTTLAVAIGIVRDQGLKSDKLAEEFNKMALSAKKN